MFWISTCKDAVMYLIVGSSTPDAAFKRILRTGFSTMLVILLTMICMSQNQALPLGQSVQCFP